MRKSAILQALFILSCIYLTVQFFVLPRFFEKKTPLEQVLQHFNGIPLFLVEKDILEHLVHSQVPMTTRLLQTAQVLTFGLIHEEDTIDKIRHVKGQLQQNGFYYSEVISDIGTETTVTNVFLQHDSLLVHIVIFLPQSSSTLATFTISQSDYSFLNNPHGLTFIEKAHIFDRFQLQHGGEVSVPRDVIQFLTDLQDSTYIPCNHTRAQDFLSRHPDDHSDEAKHFKRKARQMIARAKQYLEDLGIPFWLSSGTCLGWFRQCDIITYSKDVDFGVHIDHYKPELIPMFERGGFFLKNSFGKVSDSYELSFQAGDIKLDIFFFYNETDHIWNGGTEYLTGKKLKYTFPPFSMCWSLFLGLKVRVPCPPQAYIEANYGQDWMEPITDWQWDKSPPNVQSNGYWLKEEVDEVVQVF